MHSSFNLILLNLWIGLCGGHPRLPRDLRELGYDAKWIEYRFQNQDGETIHPEMIVCSSKMAHTLLLEFKSGKNLDNDQLYRYSRVTQEDLRQLAMIPISATSSHDISIIGKEENAERLRIGLDAGPYNFPFLVCNALGIHLFLNKFSVQSLNNLFSKGLAIDWGQVPTMYVPILHDSESWEIAEVIIPIILGHMHQRKSRIEVEQISIESCKAWSSMGSPAKKEYRSQVSKVLAEASRSSFREYFHYKSDQKGGYIEISNNPIEMGTDKRTGAYKKLQTLQREFIAKLIKEAGQTSLDLDSTI